MKNQGWRSKVALIAFLGVALPACSAQDGQAPDSSSEPGGETPGDENAGSAATATEGASTSGGNSAMGGDGATGGAVASSNNAATGGSVATGAVAPSGGEPAAGGHYATSGGNSAIGGGPATAGGSVASGASPATGGGQTTGGNPTVGGDSGTGGAPPTGGEPGSGGDSATGGEPGTSSGGAACSSTAPVGLKKGDLVPDVQFQHCDGTSVSLRELVCGNVLTQVYSYAGWCPGCRGFSGLEGESFMNGNEIYDSYHDDGFEQVIVLSATEDFVAKPTESDCAELQALHKGLVVFDSTSSKMEDELGLQINGGTALLDEAGLWVVSPPEEGVEVEGGGFSEVFSELMDRFGW